MSVNSVNQSTGALSPVAGIPKATIDGITAVIPSNATSTNQLVTQADSLISYPELQLYTLVAEHSDITTGDKLAQYIYDTYFASAGTLKDNRISIWVVANPNDSAGRYTACAGEISNHYLALTGTYFAYGRLTYEHKPYEHKLVATIQVTQENCLPMKCIYGNIADYWGVGVTFDAISGWYIDGGQPKWVTIATVTSLPATGATLNIPMRTLNGRRFRVKFFTYSIVDLNLYGSSNGTANLQGSNEYASADSKIGFVLYWADISSSSVQLSYYVNNVATALNTTVTIQACRDDL